MNVRFQGSPKKTYRNYLKTCIWSTELTFLGSSLNCVSSSLNTVILDKSHPRWPVPTTVINILYRQVAVILPPQTAQNVRDTQSTSSKDFPAIKELPAGAWIQPNPEEQPSPHPTFIHVTRNGDKRSRTERSWIRLENLHVNLGIFFSAFHSTSAMYSLIFDSRIVFLLLGMSWTCPITVMYLTLSENLYCDKI